MQQTFGTPEKRTRPGQVPDKLLNIFPKDDTPTDLRVPPTESIVHHLSFRQQTNHQSLNRTRFLYLSPPLSTSKISWRPIIPLNLFQNHPDTKRFKITPVKQTVRIW